MSTLTLTQTSKDEVDVKTICHRHLVQAVSVLVAVVWMHSGCVVVTCMGAMSKKTKRSSNVPLPRLHKCGARWGFLFTCGGCLPTLVWCFHASGRGEGAHLSLVCVHCPCIHTSMQM